MRFCDSKQVPVCIKERDKKKINSIHTCIYLFILHSRPWGACHSLFFSQVTQAHDKAGLRRCSARPGADVLAALQLYHFLPTSNQSEQYPQHPTTALPLQLGMESWSSTTCSRNLWLFDHRLSESHHWIKKKHIEDGHVGRTWWICKLVYIWLVVSTPLKNMKVNWDD